MIILFIAIIVGTVFGVIGGILGVAWGGEPGFIALIIGSVLIFIGAVYGIYKVSTSMRSLRTQQKKKPVRNTFVWLAVTIVSGAGAVLTYFLGMKLYQVPLVLMLIVIVILASVCLFSIFVLSSGGKRKKEIAFTETTTDVEDKTSE